MLRLFCVPLGILTLGATLSGCGLIDSDVASFTLRLPEKEVTVDTQQWMLTQSGSMPSIPCAGMESICSQDLSSVCGAGAETCTGTCEAPSCAVNVRVSLFNEFDLQREVPELERIEDKPLAEVSIDRVYYSVNENTLNVASPEMKIFIAPQGVMETSDPLAEEIGRIEPVPAQTTIAEADVIFTDQGEATLKEHFRNFATPFNLIVGSDLQLQAGDPIPTGRMVSVIKVEATASPGF